jgi:hypothetical protein
MVNLDNPISQSIDPTTQFYDGDCHSLLAKCCTSRKHLTSTLKFRPMTRKRRQMAFDMLRQMKQQQLDIRSTRSNLFRHKKRFYKSLCCTGKTSELIVHMERLICRDVFT